MAAQGRERGYVNRVRVVDNRYAESKKVVGFKCFSAYRYAETK